MKIPFAGNILIIGNGAISTCLQVLLQKNIDYDFRRITIIDRISFNKTQVPLSHGNGAQFIQEEITRENYNLILSRYLKAGDLLIDLGFSIETVDLIAWCQNNKVLFINSSIESWPIPDDKILEKSESLYEKYNAMLKKTSKWRHHGPTAIVDHGANPGLVNHWTKQALEDIAHKYINSHTNNVTSDKLKEALQENNFAILAMLSQTKIIHVAERDGQIIGYPKPVNTFMNTWSVDSFHEEFIAPAEITWGSHEKQMPKEATMHETGPRHHIFFNKRAMNTKVNSWVPSGPLIAMIVRHGEVYSLGRYLTLESNNTLQYRPTILYAYQPCPVAIESLIESKNNNYQLQENKHVINDEIIMGNDELGVLLLGPQFNGWWIGSELSIEETRVLAPGQNATTLQVAAGVFGALLWLFENTNKGFFLPDDLPHKFIIDKTKKFLGKFASFQINGDINRINNTLDQDNYWQFKNFIIDE